MKVYRLPTGEETSLDNIIRVYPPAYDWPLFWKRFWKRPFGVRQYHFFELELKPGRRVRVYDDKEMLRYHSLLHLLNEADRLEIVC